MFIQRFTNAGRPGGRERNIHDLLLLMIAAVEIANSRREVLDHINTQRARYLPDTLRLAERHAVYETTVVYEFYQLAQQDFALHDSIPVWERSMKLTDPEPGGNQNKVRVDLSLFSPKRGTETRIEVGKSDAVGDRDRKLEDDSEKLLGIAPFRSLKPASVRGLEQAERRDAELQLRKLAALRARNGRLGARSQSTQEKNEAIRTRTGQVYFELENFVLLFNFAESKLTRLAADAWHDRSEGHAVHASGRLGAHIRLEATGAADLLSTSSRAHRSALAAVFSVRQAAPLAPVGPAELQVEGDVPDDAE